MTTTTKGTGAARLAKLYYSTAFETPSWNLVNRVRGHKLPLGKNGATVEGRDLAAEIELPGALKVGPLTFKYRHLKGATDAVYTALYTSYTAHTAYLWLECDDLAANVGCKGQTFPGYVKKMDKSAENNHAIEYDVEVVYCETYDESGDLVELAAFTVAAP
jgi:hypothetical protein